MNSFKKQGLKSHFFYCGLALLASFFFFGVIRSSAFAITYYWGEGYATNNPGATQGWFVDYVDADGNVGYQAVANMPTSLNGYDSISVYATPNNELLDYLKNITVTNGNLELFIAYTSAGNPRVPYDYELSSAFNSISINAPANITISSNLDRLSLESDDVTVTVNGNVKEIYTNKNNKLGCSVTISGNVDSIDFYGKNPDLILDQYDSYHDSETDRYLSVGWYGGSIRVAGTVSGGTYRIPTFNATEHTIEYLSKNTIGFCSAGSFSADNGFLSNSVPLEESNIVGYYYDYYNSWSSQDNGSTKDGTVYWNRGKVEINADGRERTISYANDVDISDIKDGDSLVVHDADVTLTIDEKLRYFDITNGYVTFNGDLEEGYYTDFEGNRYACKNDINFTPGTKGVCNLVVNSSFDNMGLCVQNNERNKEANLYIAQEIKGGGYLVRDNSGYYYYYQYFDAPADTQLIKDGKWNQDIPIRLTREIAEDTVSTKVVSDDVLADALSAEEIGREFTVTDANGDVFVVVKKADVAIQQSYIDEDTEQSVLETIAQSGVAGGETYEVAATLEIDLNTFFEKEDGSVYSDDNYYPGRVTQLTGGKSLTIPFKIANYDSSAVYKVVRIHVNEDGTVSQDVLDTNDLGSGWLSFTSDKFSTFVIIKVGGGEYVAPQRTFGSIVELYGTGFMGYAEDGSAFEPESCNIDVCSQGDLAMEAFRNAIPTGYTELFTFNLGVNWKYDYFRKTGNLRMNLFDSFAGKDVKLIVLEPNKGARVIDYTEFAPGDGAFVIDTEGYAFMFVYKDGAGVGSALSGSYVVRDGDTLNKIAASLGTNASSLASINGIKNPNYICVGQVIRY